jgi:hypothetical protein
VRDGERGAGWSGAPVTEESMVGANPENSGQWNRWCVDGLAYDGRVGFAQVLILWLGGWDGCGRTPSVALDCSGKRLAKIGTGLS